MTYQPANRCAGCEQPERCAALIEHYNTDGERADQCACGLPMHEGCPWKKTVEQIREK